MLSIPKFFETLMGDSSPFGTDKNELLFRIANPNAQIGIRHSIKQQVLDVSHYPVFAVHLGGSNVYYRVDGRFYWAALGAN